MPRWFTSSSVPSSFTRAYNASSVYAGPRRTSAPPELLQMPPSTDAPMHDEPMTECGLRPSGASVCSSLSRVAPGRHTT